MANVKTTFVQSQNIALPGNASTWKSPLATTYGFFAIATNETNIQRPTGVYSNLRARVVTNTNNNTTIVRVKNNNVNGNNSISISATQTGSFEDISHTDSVTAGNANTFLECAVVSGSTGSITFGVTQIDFLASADTHNTLSSHGTASFTTASTTGYNSLTSTLANNNTTESNTQVQFRSSYTLKNFRIRIITDARSTNTTHRIRKNAANGSQSIATTNTGEFEDVTNTDTVVANDKICVSSTTSTGSGAHDLAAAAVDVVNTVDTAFPHIVSGGATQNFGTTLYESGGHSLPVATEANVQVKLYKSSVLENLGANVSANTVNNTTTIQMRKNGANANPVVSIAASTSGFFTDNSSTTTTADNDLVNFVITTTGTSGSITYRSLYVEIAQVTIQNITKQIDESYNVTEAVTRLKTASRPLSDTYNVTESVSIVVNHVKSINESYNVSEALTRFQTLTRQLADSYNVTDAVARSQILTRALNESYNVTETLARVITFLRSLSDTYNVTETLSRLESLTRLINESYNVIDSVNRTIRFNRSLSDSYNVTEAVTKSQALTRSLSESYNVTEAITRLISFFRSLADTYNVSDSVTRSQILTRLINETYDVTDTLQRIQGSIRNLSESYDITEAVTKLQNLTRQLTDTYNITDVVSNAASFNVTLEEIYDVTDSVTRSLQLTRELADTYNITDNLTKLIALQRLLEETFDVNETLIRQTLLLRTLSDTYNVTETVDREIAPAGDHIFVELEETYNVTDTISKDLALQRLLTESYNITDAIQVEGGQEPVIVTEESASGGGGQTFSLSKLKRRIIKKTIEDLLPNFNFNNINNGVPDKIYINNQKAFFLNPEKEPQNIIVSPIRVQAKLYNQNNNNSIKSHVKTIKQYRLENQLKQIYRDLEIRKISTQQFIESLPNKIYVTNYKNGKILNPDLTNTITSNLKPNKTVTKYYNNHIICPIKLIPTNNNVILSTLKVKNAGNLYNNLVLSSLGTIKTNQNNCIISKVRYTPKTHNTAISKVINAKKETKRNIKSILMNKGKITYDVILENILNKVKDDKKEHLHYYISTYQTKFEIENTKTNQDLDKLDRKYKKPLKELYEKIVSEYSNKLYALEEAKQKYGKQVYDLIRSVATKGYNISIDYVTRATERQDIYLTDKDIQNVKEQTDKSYMHFWESVEKHIKKKQNREATEDLQLLGAENKTEHEFPIDESIILLLKGITTSMLAFATFDKLYQMRDILQQRNISIRYVFVTEQDALVCPKCYIHDYRLTGMEYTYEEYPQIPKPPIHFNCRCRLLLKVNNRLIVK